MQRCTEALNQGNVPNTAQNYASSKKPLTHYRRRARIKAQIQTGVVQMSKADKDGWIRHRGGKCPVGAGTMVDVKLRCKHHEVGVLADDLQWVAYDHPDDVMRYRLHKPAEQPAPVSEEVMHVGIDAADAGKLTTIEDVKARFTTDGPLQWRDRIQEIDRNIEALEEERASLVQRLEAEGFRLIARTVRPVENMSDWRNWKKGDLIRHVEGGWADFTKGALYQLNDVSETELFLDDDVEPRVFSVDEDTLFSNGKFPAFKFHSRPST